MKLACQEQLLPGATLPAKFEAAQRFGFDGIELRARGDGHFATRLPELRAAARSGVVMRTVCPDTDHFIGHFDADRRRARVHVDDSNRMQPGTGHLDFPAVFDALHEIGYDGWLTLECRLRGAPEDALPETTRFLRRFA
jgi:sugar phosphate isomerase/epimerase